MVAKVRDMSAIDRRKLTAAEYLSLEHHAETRSEFIAGEVRAMSGATMKHTIIVGNLMVELGQQLKGKRCSVLAHDMRVKTVSLGSYFYPDLVGICGPADLEQGVTDTLLNPTVVIEILSPSTEAYDRGEKFFHYQQIESLRQYVLVSQFQPRVEIYTRSAEGRWEYQVISGAEARLPLASLEAEVSLAEVYRGVDLAAPVPDGLR